jgi:hypothetical protein
VAIGRCDAFVHSKANVRARNRVTARSRSQPHRSQSQRSYGQPSAAVTSVNWFIPEPRARNRSTRRGCPRIASQLQKSIDDVVRARLPAKRRETRRANPKRETAPGETTPRVGSRWQNREIGTDRRCFRAASATGSARRLREERTRLGTHTKFGNERSTRAQTDRWKPLSGRGIRSLFTSDRWKRPWPNPSAVPTSERSETAWARRQKRQRLARFKDERTNAIFEIVRGIKNRLTRGRKRRRVETGRVTEACGAS